MGLLSRERARARARAGKAVKQIIPFEGNEKAFETILKQLNR
jgi:preprotein translocase subunit SecD